MSTHVSDQRSFQLWVYATLEAVCAAHGLPVDNIYYPGLVDGNQESSIPQNDLHVRVWVRPSPSSGQPYSMGTRDQKRRHVSTGNVYVKVNYPIGKPSLLTSAWALGILLQRKFQSRNHPCGIMMPSVTVSELDRVDNDPYFQLTVTARYEFDEYV